MNTKVPTMHAGGHLSPIYPHSIEEVYRLATMALKSGMLKPVSKGYGDAAEVEDEAATLARGTMIIMQGMEIGLPPMQSLQLLAMINGRIVAHSEAVPGLLLAHGFKIKERWTGTEMADDWTCHVELTRRNGDTHTSSFSVKDAKQARLWDQRDKITKKGKGGSTYQADNDSPWFKYPKRMLRARAIGFAGKDFGADALRGIQTHEEAEDMLRVEHSRDITPEPSPELPDIPDVPDEPPQDEPLPVANVDEYLKHYAEELAATDGETRLEFIEGNADIVAQLPSAAKATIARMIGDAA